jgi:hypothetical protein
MLVGYDSTCLSAGQNRADLNPSGEIARLLTRSGDRLEQRSLS